MDVDHYEKSPGMGRNMNIMDTVSGRNCKYSRISSESGLGDAYIQINDPIKDRLENNHSEKHVGYHDGNSLGMDGYRSKQGSLQRCGSSEYLRESHNASPQRPKKCRFIKKTGHCNVSHAHLRDRSQRFMADIFTTCVDLRWRWNLLLFSTAFITSWMFFGILYWIISYAHGDFAQLEEDRPIKSCVNNLDPMAPFTSAFLFSLETQTTIGYGYRVVSEECAFTIFMVVVQSVFGCVIDAFMIGLIMAKISRPKKRAETLLFTKKAVINIRDGQLCLMVRVGNLRKSHLVEATIRMQYLYSRTTLEGEYIPLEQIDLHLDLKNDSDRLFLVTPQTICHPIDSDSPLYKLSKELLKDADFEVIVILEGMVEATGMTTQARASYLPNEILWGHRFENVITFSQSNGYNVNFKKFDNTYETSSAPTCSSAELIHRQLMITNGPVDHHQRRSNASLTRRSREYHSVSDGRDSGYTPAVEEEEDRASESTKTLSSTSSTGSSFSRGSSELKQRSWIKHRRGAEERMSSESKLDDAVFLSISEKNVNQEKRKSIEVDSQTTELRNEKNAILNGSRNNSQGSGGFPYKLRNQNNNDQKSISTNQLQSHNSNDDDRVTSSPNDVEPKTVVVVVPVKESPDETVSLLQIQSPEKESTFVAVSDRRTDNNLPRTIDSPV